MNVVPEPIVGVPSLVTAPAERSSVISLACVIFLICFPFFTHLLWLTLRGEV